MKGRETGNDFAPPPPLAGQGRGGGKRRRFVKPAARARARALRLNSTDAERLMWLWAHRLDGFRRQVPIGPYIVDFVSHRAKPAIEIDGGQHFDAEQAAKDAGRTVFLSGKGYPVLRFSNLDVIQNRSGVLSVIAEALGNTPSLSLPRKRGREKDLARPEQNRMGENA